MKKSLLVLSTLLITIGASAQQDMLVTHFIFNKMTFNPGAAGIDDGICGTMLYRNQWDRVNGAPNSALLNVEANLHRWAPVGVGLSFAHDAIGFNRQNNLLLNGVYHVITRHGTLGIGAGAGMINFGLAPVWVPPVTLVDATLPAASSVTALDVNFGLYWKASEKPYYVGLSATHLNAPILGASAGTSYNVARHYYAMGGYTFRGILANGNGSIDAQAMVRTDLVATSVDLNVRYLHANLFYAGLTYRTFDGVAFMGGFMPPMIKNFMIGYSYDLTLNKLATISRGSHELVLKYCYYLPPVPRTVTLHPRYL
jgi:type IX secretion system PorP/SprF family membrane protein